MDMAVRREPGESPEPGFEKPANPTKRPGPQMTSSLHAPGRSLETRHPYAGLV